MTYPVEHGFPSNGHHAEPSGDPSTLSVSAHRSVTTVAPVWPPVANGTSTPKEARLGDLVGRAESAVGELERLARTTLDATAAATQAAGDLQERLRLGVRMLQAFDVQIGRSQQSGQELVSQILPHLQGQIAAYVQNQLQAQHAAIAQQSELRVRAAVEAIEHRVAELLPFLDERIRHANDQFARLMDERLAAAERRIDERYAPVKDDFRAFADETVAAFTAKLDAIVRERMTNVGTAADPNQLASLEERIRNLLAESEHRARSVETILARAEERARLLNQQSVEAADSLLGTIGTATTLKDLVAEEAQSARRHADEAQAATRELARDLHTLIERCATVRGGIGQDLASYTNATRIAEEKASAVRSLTSELDTMLARLAPWESLLRNENGPSHGVVETVANVVRQGMADDMRNFSYALRQLANRADHAFTNGRFDEFSALGDPGRVAATPPVAPGPASPATSPTTTPHHGTTAAAPSIATNALPIDTRRLTAEILALDASGLLGSPSSLRSEA